MRSCQFDKDNDHLYVYPKKDVNKNGKIENEEPIQIFWIDLKDTSKRWVKFAAE